MNTTPPATPMKPAGMAQAAALAPIRENRIMVPASILSMAVDHAYFHHVVVSALNRLAPRVEEEDVAFEFEEVMPTVDLVEELRMTTLPLPQELLLRPITPVLYPVSPRCIFDTEVTALDTLQVDTLPTWTFTSTEEGELPPTLPVTPLVTEPLPMFPETYADLLQVWPVIPMPPTLPATPVDMPVTLPATPVGDAPRTPEVYRMKRAGPIEAGETNAPKRPCMIDKSFAGGESDSDGELNLMDEI